MRKIVLSLILLATVPSVYSQSPDPNLGIIPAPQSVRITGGQFTFSREAAIMYGSESDRKIAELFHDFLRDNYFLDLPIAKAFIKAPKQS